MVDFKVKIQLEKDEDIMVLRNLIERYLPSAEFEIVSKYIIQRMKRNDRLVKMLNEIILNKRITTFQLYKKFRGQGMNYKLIQRDLMVLALQGKITIKNHKGSGGNYNVIEARF